MKKNILLWSIAFIVVIIAIYTTGAFNTNPTDENLINDSNQNETISESQKSPNFTLTDLDGNSVSLSDYEGKNVYVNFFATWCPPCKAEMPEIEKISQKYKDKDLVVLAIDIGEDYDTVKSFVQENNYTFKVLLDSDQAVATQYNITSIPVSLFIDKQGNIVSKKIGAMTMEDMEVSVQELLNQK